MWQSIPVSGKLNCDNVSNLLNNDSIQILHLDFDVQNLTFYNLP